MGRPKGSRNGQYTLVSLTCHRCSKAYQVKPSAVATSRYCSTACYHPPRPMVHCKRCGKEYLPEVSTLGVYCSMTCMRNRVEKVCVGCGKTFEVKVSKASRFNYCSQACKHAYFANQPIVTCQQCGKEFAVRHERKDTARFCSRACQWASGRATITCAYCGEAKTLKRYRVNQENTRCCSNRCATLLRMENGFAPGYIGAKLRAGYRTDIEAMTERVLLDLHIPYLFEHKVRRFLVDFALPTLGIALECDGWQHTTERGRAHDAMRDPIIEAEGWRVVHVPDNAIRADAYAAIRKALELDHLTNPSNPFNAS